MRIYDFEPQISTVTQLKCGKKQSIEEVISKEEAFEIEYTCTFQEQEYKGSKVLYAFPFQVPYLALGHVVNDCLPCPHGKYKVDFHEKNHKVVLQLQGEPAEEKALIYEPLPMFHILETMDLFLSKPGNWDGTGCFHRAALFHPINHQLILAEDIGRHNCIDRLVGYAIMNDLNISHHFLFITARITASLYHKASRAGFHTMISRSAITSEAFNCAQTENISIAGFCRPDEKRITVFHNGMFSFL